MHKKLGLFIAFAALLLTTFAYSQNSSFSNLGFSQTEKLDSSTTTNSSSASSPTTSLANATNSKSTTLPLSGELPIQEGSAGQVVWVKGVITATYPEQASRSLARGSAIYEKDTLTTDANSTGEIIFTDNSLVSLRPNTTLFIKKYHFSQQKLETSGQYILNLIKGGFRTITGLIAKFNPDNYQVKIPFATIAVRGTTYNTNCQNGQCAVGLEQGKGVIVQNGGGVVELTPTMRFAVITSSEIKPMLSNLEPAILAKPPIMLPATAPPSPDANSAPKAGSDSNCGILIQ